MNDSISPNRELMDDILAHDSSICSVMSPDGRIIYVSPYFNAAFGTVNDDLIGKLWSETDLPGSFTEAMETGRKQVISTFKDVSISINVSTSLDSLVYECSQRPTIHPDGTIKNIVSFYISDSAKNVETPINHILDHILNKLQEASDIDEAIPSVLSYVSSLFNADMITMLFRYEDQWYTKYVHGATDSPQDVIFLEEHAALAHSINKRKKIISIHQSDKSSYFAKSLPKSWGIRSITAAPLHIQGEVFAILTVSSRRDCRPFTEYQKEALSRVASIMALAFSEDRYIWSRDGESDSAMKKIGLIDVGVALLNSKDNSIIWSNRTYDEIIPQAFRGMGIFDLHGYYMVSEKFDHVATGEMIRGLTSTDGPKVYGCFQRRNRSGVLTFWQVSFVPVGKGDGSPDLLCLVLNISDWENSNKKAARLVRAILEEQFRVKTLIDALPVGVYISDAEGHILEIGSKGTKIWGGTAPLPRDIEEYGDYIAWSTVSGKRMTVEDWPITKAVKHGEITVGEVIDYRNFEGKRGTIINSAAPIRNRNGTVIGAVEIDHDITEMKRLERELVAAKASLEAFINQMPAGVAIAEAPSGRVISCNDELVRMCPLNLGMPRCVEDYSRWGLLDPIDLKPIHSEDYPMAIALNENRTVAGTETVIKRNNNSYMTVISSASPVVNGDGKAIGVVSIFTDITKQKEAERLLEKQTRDLAQFNADLQRFAYVTSNELRESLKTITNYLSLIDKNSS